MFKNLIQVLNKKKTYPFKVLYGTSLFNRHREFLALIFADQPHLGYYYAHIAKHPKKNCWISCIVYSSHFIIGKTINEWIYNFHYWISVRLEYEPVSKYIAHYSYSEAISFENAIIELEKMIAQFNVAAIYQEFDNDMPSNIEILDFYGMTDYRNAKGEFPAIPQYNDIIFH